MLCPRCHNDNPDTNLTCDFCMAELPLSDDRKKLIKNKEKQELKSKLQNSKDIIFGMVTALLAIIIVIVLVVVVF